MQTARGTSLSKSPAGPGTTSGGSRVWLVLACALVILGLDQASKAIAVATLADRAPIELVGGFLSLRLVRNPGAAFGMASGFTVVLSTVAIVVTVVIVRMARRLTSLPWAIALSLLLGGALGNLVDRIFRPPAPLRGHVIDFLELPYWPVFNLADSSIVSAAVLMFLLTLRGVPITTKDPDPDPAPASPPADRSD